MARGARLSLLHTAALATFEGDVYAYLETGEMGESSNVIPYNPEILKDMQQCQEATLKQAAPTSNCM